MSNSNGSVLCVVVDIGVGGVVAAAAAVVDVDAHQIRCGCPEVCTSA